MTVDRKTFLELIDGGYIAQQGSDVLLRCSEKSWEIRIAGPVLEAVLKACLEAKGVELGGTYTIRVEGGGGGARTDEKVMARK